jgi:AsmA protein
MSLSEIGLYEGQAAAGFAVDASVPTPVYALRANLANVRALQLLTSVADFTSLDGRMQGQLDVRSMGKNQNELMSNMAGTATFSFRDGQIIGINVADMVRSLTKSTLSGWQQDAPTAAQGTDLTELNATFQIDKGQATTSDLRLAGPLVRMTGTGSASLPNRTLSFRMEPKLVMTTQGQGGQTDPVGLGVPVVIDGPWANPRIYPDMAGILDNPEAAFGKLREMGQGLFGPGMLGGGDGKSDNLIGNIGNMIKGLGGGAPQGQGQPPAQATPAAPAPADQKPADARPSAPSSGTPPADNKPFPIDRIIRDLFGR